MNTHPMLSGIRDDDPDLLKIMLGIRTPILPISEIIALGPHGRTKVYEGINEGLLVSFISNTRRFVFAADYAKYLLALKRIGETEGSRHHLAKAVNRPGHDPKHTRAA